VLSVIQSLDEARKWLKKACDKDDSIPRTLFEPLLMYRWTSLSEWRPENQIYQDPEANNLISMIEALRVIHTQVFIDSLSRAFAERRSLEVLNEKLGMFNRSAWNHLLFTSLGALVEKRGYYLDSSRYYNWAIQQSDDPLYKKDMWIRWIVSRERHAEMEDNPQYKQEAISKRTELGIAPDTVFPPESRFEHWRSLFERIIQVSEKVREPVPDEEQGIVRPNFSENHTRSNEVSTVTEPLNAHDATTDMTEQASVNPSDKLFDFEAQGYKFRFNPVKNELIISLRSESEDLRIKIQNGQFPADADFRVDGNRLKKPDGTVAPFKVDLNRGHMRLTFVDSGVIWLLYSKSQK